MREKKVVSRNVAEKKDAIRLTIAYAKAEAFLMVVLGFIVYTCDYFYLGHISIEWVQEFARGQTPSAFDYLPLGILTALGLILIWYGLVLYIKSEIITRIPQR